MRQISYIEAQKYWEDNNFSQYNIPFDIYIRVFWVMREHLKTMFTIKEGKERLIVYDLVDDFRSKGHVNFLYRHGRERCDIYIRKELVYEEKKIEL